MRQGASCSRVASTPGAAVNSAALKVTQATPLQRQVPRVEAVCPLFTWNVSIHLVLALHVILPLLCDLWTVYSTLRVQIACFAQTLFLVHLVTDSTPMFDRSHLYVNACSILQKQHLGAN